MNEWYDEKLDYVIGRDEIDERLPKMRAKYYFESINREDLEKYKKNGWSIDKEYKAVVHVKKEKTPDDIFEDEFWCLLAEMGFKYLSADRINFKLQVDGDDQKQVDVFGIDEDVVVIAECKAAKNPGTRYDFRNDIYAIEKYKDTIPKYLNSHFLNYKPKYVFFFCTSNYAVSKDDIERINNAGIIWFDEKRIEYYRGLTGNLGVLAKYQFFGEILQGKDIPGLKSIRVPAIKTRLGGFNCYSMMINPQKLLKICFVLHRTDKLDFDHSYQRYIKKNRINQIKEYVKNGGYFPNSIIINFSNSSLQFDQFAQQYQTEDNCRAGTLTLPAKYKSAFIIDGQHRLYGYAGIEDPNAIIPVIAFEQIPPEAQTKMFVDINTKAKAVKRNLLESLNGELYWGSDDAKVALQALNSMLAMRLGNKKNSPLYNCIQFEDEKNSSSSGKITLTYFIDKGLRDEKYFVKEFHKKKNTPTVYGPFYDGDLTENSLEKAYEVLSLYYGMIKESCPTQWSALLTNVGVSTLSLLLSELLDDYERNHQSCYSNMKAKDIFATVQNRVEIFCSELKKKSNEDIKKYQKGNFGYGGTAKTKPYFEQLIYEVDKSFNPAGLEKWIREQSGQYSAATEKMITALSDEIVSLTHNELINKFGDNYFLKLPANVLTKVQERYNEEEHPDILLEIEDIRDIALNNWKGMFDNVLDDRSLQQGDKNAKTNYLSYISAIKVKLKKNEAISEEEYDKVTEIYNWFKSSHEIEDWEEL